MNRRPKILLADDADFFIDLEKNYLKQTPADILVTDNGQDALRIARSELPSLIYLDAVMPDMDGLSCCRQIKNDPYLRTIPVVLIFPSANDVDSEGAAQAGADGYLCKPLERISFLNAGHKHLFAIDRRETRYPCKEPVNFSVNRGVSLLGTTYDINSGGIYIQYRQLVEPETNIQVVFCLPSISTVMIEAKGRVAWVNQGFPRKFLSIPQGFGVQFMQISKDSSEIVRAFIAQQQEASPTR